MRQEPDPAKLTSTSGVGTHMKHASTTTTEKQKHISPKEQVVKSHW